MKTNAKIGIGIPQACSRLKQLREAAGLKHREMGALLGVPRQDHYKHFEKRTRPTREMIAAIQKQFGVPPEAFLDDESFPTTEFNQIIENLRVRTSRSVSKLVPDSQMTGHTVSRGDAGPHSTEGHVGQGSIDFIFATLTEIKAQIAENRKLIDELHQGRKAPPGFRKGRTGR